MFQSSRQKLDRYIDEGLKEYTCVLCDPSGCYDNEKARKDLRCFFEHFIKLSPDRKYNSGNRRDHYSYCITLLKMKVYLINKKYPEFCHELITLHHCENLLQKRIYFNIISLYENFFR